jgi:hypothetical protein
MTTPRHPDLPGFGLSSRASLEKKSPLDRSESKAADALAGVDKVVAISAVSASRFMLHLVLVRAWISRSPPLLCLGVLAGTGSQKVVFRFGLGEETVYY